MGKHAENIEKNVIIQENENIRIAFIIVNDDMYGCNVCGKSAKRERTISKHVIRDHLSQTDPNQIEYLQMLYEATEQRIADILRATVKNLTTRFRESYKNLRSYIDRRDNFLNNFHAAMDKSIPETIRWKTDVLLTMDAVVDIVEDLYNSVDIDDPYVHQKFILFYNRIKEITLQRGVTSQSTMANFVEQQRITAWKKFVDALGPLSEMKNLCERIIDYKKELENKE